jgi:hypothetical protein
MFTTPQTLRNVRGISEEDKSQIKAFMQGAVYCWVKNRMGEWFAVRDLMGGLNWIWHDTPLQVLYDKHANSGKDNEAAMEAAAKDLGWLTKAVLSDDRRSFDVRKAGLVSSYRWVGNEP